VSHRRRVCGMVSRGEGMAQPGASAMRWASRAALLAASLLPSGAPLSGAGLCVRRAARAWQPYEPVRGSTMRGRREGRGMPPRGAGGCESTPPRMPAPLCACPASARVRIALSRCGRRAVGRGRREAQLSETYPARASPRLSRQCICSTAPGPLCADRLLAPPHTPGARAFWRADRA